MRLAASIQHNHEDTPVASGVAGGLGSVGLTIEGVIGAMEGSAGSAGVVGIGGLADGADADAGTNGIGSEATPLLRYALDQFVYERKTMSIGHDAGTWRPAVFGQYRMCNC